MGVYNPNMEMPRNCTECLEFGNDCEHYWDYYCTHESRPTDCPLIEIDLVRCGECKWWEKMKDSYFGYCHAEKHCHFSNNWEISIYRTYKADHFCADGERRADGDI